MAILSERSEKLLREARQVLLALEMLSDTESGWHFDNHKARKRAPTSKCPPRQQSAVSNQLDGLEVWLAGAEREVGHAKRRPPDRIPDYRSWAKWVVEVYADELDVSVAHAEHCEVSLVHKARRQHGKTIGRGRPVRAQLAA